MSAFTEAELEQVFLDQLELQHYDYLSGDSLHRETTDVLIEDDLREFLRNRYAAEGITESEISQIVMSLKSASALPVYDANKRMFARMTQGETFVREDRSRKDFLLQLMDFRAEGNCNLYKVVNQLTIKGPEATRRPDAVLYVNGLPVVIFEFKSAIKEDATIRSAYLQITRRYMRDIPELFKYICFAVISDGINTRMGSNFADYEHFFSWRRVNPDDKPVDGADALYAMMNGLFRHDRLLDVIQNFIFFPDSDDGKSVKIVCSYPQYFAARKLLANLLRRRDGKGGTYFGTTGCGKSYIMLFLCRLILREPSLKSPTVALITDRTDLDDQLSATFLNAKNFLGDKTVVSVGSRDELRDALTNTASGGVYLTTIQKFAEEFNELSRRDNIICISDEAHRTQISLEPKLTVKGDEVLQKYGFAKFLHTSLPNAAYIGFTGTPVDKTMSVFGSVVDQYTMSDSVKDGVTVRLVYDGRAAKACLDNDKVREIEDYYNQCLARGSNAYQVEASKKAVTNLSAIIGDRDILNTVADFFIAHYESRVREGSTVAGKCMFVCYNRTIAFEFYKILKEKRPAWFEERIAPKGAVLTEKDRRELRPMPMCKFVATRSKDDDGDMYALLGSDKDRKDAAVQFKNIHANFKIAIVVDLWLTGFDVPFLDCIYIDKPLAQSHSIIQTISRINRAYEGKDCGLIVDFIGMKQALLTALKTFTDFQEEEFSKEEAETAVRIVKDQLEVMNAMMSGFDSSPYFNGTPSEKLATLNRAAEHIQATKGLEERFMSNVRRMKRAFNLCNVLTDFTQEELDAIYYYVAVRSILHKLTRGDAPDAEQMNAHVAKMVQDAVRSEGIDELFSAQAEIASDVADLFSEEYLERIRRIKLPNTRIKVLQQLLTKAIRAFKRVNKIKAVSFEKRLKEIVERYNTRVDDVSVVKDILNDIAQQMFDLLRKLEEEEASFESMGIDYEEKAFYDILTAVAEKFKFEFPAAKNIELARQIRAKVRDKTRYADWSARADIKAEMQCDIIMLLSAAGYPPTPPEIYEQIYANIIEQAENFKKYCA